MNGNSPSASVSTPTVVDVTPLHLSSKLASARVPGHGCPDGTWTHSSPSRIKISLDLGTRCSVSKAEAGPAVLKGTCSSVTALGGRSLVRPRLIPRSKMWSISTDDKHDVRHCIVAAFLLLAMTSEYRETSVAVQCWVQ